jgi:hypothetical protein
MSPSVLVLATSVAANAALLGLFVAKPALAPPGVRSFFELRPASPSEADFGATSRPGDRSASIRAAAKEAPSFWQTLNSPDLTRLVAQLRAAGFPNSIVRSIIDAEIAARFAPQIKELTREMHETPYWKPDPSLYSGSTQRFEAISKILRERTQLLRSLLGQDAFASGSADPTAAQRRQYGSINPAKIDLVQRINDDYAEMTGQIRASMQGITLPEDREKLALLEREKRADLAALLTPTELADYEMRTSPVTSRLRTPLGIMNASEAEFRAIFEIQQPYANVLNPVAPGRNAESVRERNEATKAINAQIKAALGDERFAQYERATNSEFQQLHRLAAGAGVSHDAIARAFDQRAPAAAASSAIANDRTLDATAKRQALQTLAQTTRTAILSTLGPVAGPAYVENARWLTHIEQGGSVSITPEGNTIYQSMRPSPPPAATTPPRN